MENFQFQNETKIIFGKHTELEVAKEVSKYSKKILLHYGGGSIKKIGLYDKVVQSLAEKVGDITFMEAQLKDGSFRDFLYPLKEDGSGVVLSSIEITSEFSFELTEIARGLTE